MDIDRRLFELCEPALDREGYELVWVQVTGTGGTRRKAVVYIDSEQGVDVESCARVSRLIDPLIEESEIFKAAYLLEVSSPGLDRPLYKSSDYEKFAGSKARVVLKRPLEGSRRNFTGILRGLDNGKILIEIEGGETFRLPLEDVHKAQLIYEWK
ncbi:MAG: ribosome maturation factor RimP [Candidatus Glassbacteria bacterium]|nr:ribosome maturation factor RimP [Candidatus Glassbacteria bacterium]